MLGLFGSLFVNENKTVRNNLHRNGVSIFDMPDHLLTFKEQVAKENYHRAQSIMRDIVSSGKRVTKMKSGPDGFEIEVSDAE